MFCLFQGVYNSRILRAENETKNEEMNECGARAGAGTGAGSADGGVDEGSVLRLRAEEEEEEEQQQAHITGMPLLATAARTTVQANKPPSHTLLPALQHTSLHVEAKGKEDMRDRDRDRDKDREPSSVGVGRKESLPPCRHYDMIRQRQQLQQQRVGPSLTGHDSSRNLVSSSQLVTIDYSRRTSNTSSNSNSKDSRAKQAWYAFSAGAGSGKVIPELELDLEQGRRGADRRDTARGDTHQHPQQQRYLYDRVPPSQASSLHSRDQDSIGLLRL